MPIGFLTDKNSFVAKVAYKKVFNRTEANFHLGTSLGSGPNWKKKFCEKKNESSGVPIRLLTKKKVFVKIVNNTAEILLVTFE